jgi:hypothetical protein
MLKTVTAAGFAGSLLFLVPGATGPPPQGEVRHMRVTNWTREPIVELYAAAVGTGAWQGDLLCRDYLLPGRSVRVDIEDPSEACRIDLKMVLDDGTVRLDRGVDACRGRPAQR